MYKQDLALNNLQRFDMPWNQINSNCLLVPLTLKISGWCLLVVKEYRYDWIIQVLGFDITSWSISLEQSVGQFNPSKWRNGVLPVTWPLNTSFTNHLATGIQSSSIMRCYIRPSVSPIGRFEIFYRSYRQYFKLSCFIVFQCFKLTLLEPMAKFHDELTTRIVFIQL